MTPIPTELRELLERIAHDDEGMASLADFEELKRLLATPPADAADMGGQAGEEVEVVRGEDTVFGRQYVRLDRHRRILAQHRQQAGKLVEALRKLTAAMACHDATPEEYNALAGAREALAAWEKTSCGK